MPIYEIKCCQCDAESEVIIIGNQDIVCPNCGSKDIKKLIASKTNIVYEGKFCSYKPRIGDMGMKRD